MINEGYNVPPIDVTRIELRRLLLQWEQGRSDTELIYAINDYFDLGLPVPPPWQTDGFDAPVGTEEERRGTKLWPGTWFDATGFATYYTAVGAAYHTGADLNNNSPKWDSDRGAPVYSIARGEVIFAERIYNSTWGNVIVIRHAPLPDGRIVYSRYAHVEDMRVKKGDKVERGQHIANVGNAFGMLAYHLHFDIVKTDVLETKPGHWPGLNRAEVIKHYVDPKEFIAAHRPRDTQGTGGDE